MFFEKNNPNLAYSAIFCVFKKFAEYAIFIVSAKFSGVNK